MKWKDISVEEFEQIKNTLSKIKDEENISDISIMNKLYNTLNSTEIKIPIEIKISKEDFRQLIILTDLSTVLEQGWSKNDENMHIIFKKLQKKFIRMHKEDVYAEDANG